MNKWHLVALLWFCGFFNYADRQSLAAVKPTLQTRMGLSDTKLGAIDSAFVITYALCAPLAGLTVDRSSRKRLVVLGLAFWSLVAIATGWARSYHELMFVRAIEGLGEAFYFPASMSLLASFHDGTTRTHTMSIHQTSVYAGSELGGCIRGEIWRAGRKRWHSAGPPLFRHSWNVLRRVSRVPTYRAAERENGASRVLGDVSRRLGQSRRVADAAGVRHGELHGGRLDELAESLCLKKIQ